MANTEGTITPASSMAIAQNKAAQSRTVQSLKPAPVAGNVASISAKHNASRSENVAEMRTTESRIQEALTRLRAHAKTPKNISFALDQRADRWMVTVKDESTGRLIRQVPGEAVLKVAHNIENLKGVLFDQVL